MSGGMRRLRACRRPARSDIECDGAPSAKTDYILRGERLFCILCRSPLARPIDRRPDRTPMWGRGPLFPQRAQGTTWLWTFVNSGDYIVWALRAPLLREEKSLLHLAQAHLAADRSADPVA